MFAHNLAGRRLALLVLTAAAIGLVVLTGFTQEPRSAPPVRVKIQDEKPQVAVAEPTGPIDPATYVNLQPQGNMMTLVRVENKMLHLGTISTLFKIDGQVVFPNTGPVRFGGRFNQPAIKGKGNKQRLGYSSTFQHGKLTITQEVEVIATKAKKPGDRRRRDALLVNYIIENKDDRPHKIGMRIFMDVYIVTNDGALFAAPTEPGKILDGVELKGKKLPDYVQFLQMPDLKNPGFVAHMTLNFGRAFEMPDRVVLTNLGAQQGPWDVAAVMAGGDSAMAVFWEPREIKAHTKKQIAYAYGQGIAPTPEGEGAFNIQLGGSFEPGKLFSVAAMVADPAPGQSLALDLPPGIERIEGKERQPVPALTEDGNSMVMWKARVLEPGRYTVRVRSSTGLTHAKIITISPGGE